MFNKVKSVTVLDNYNLLIGFVCEKNKIYDLSNCLWEINK